MQLSILIETARNEPQCARGKTIKMASVRNDVHFIEFCFLGRALSERRTRLLLCDPYMPFNWYCSVLCSTAKFNISFGKRKAISDFVSFEDVQFVLLVYLYNILQLCDLTPNFAIDSILCLSNLSVRSTVKFLKQFMAMKMTFSDKNEILFLILLLKT